MKKLIFLFTVFICVSFSTSVEAKTYGWGFRRNDSHKSVEIGSELNTLISNHNAYYMGNASSKEIYLTFDTGYEIGITEKILNVLKKENVKAAFFVTGHFLRENSDLVIRMVDEGHIVANHTWNHPDLSKLSIEEMNSELSRVEEKYKEITGQEMLKFVRPPRGTLSDTMLENLDHLDYYTVFWSLAFVDWHIDKQRGWLYSYENVMDNIHNGAIILLHTVSKDNGDALEKIIVDLKAQDYQFVPLTNLIVPIQ